MTDIPQSLQELADLVGHRVVLALIVHFGGRDMKFPRTPPAGHPILVALGDTDGRALCEAMGGGELYVPHGRAPRSVRAEVRALAARGLSRTEIARRTGVSVRHVRRAKQAPAGRAAALAPDDAAPQLPGPQMDLFDSDD